MDIRPATPGELAPVLDLLQRSKLPTAGLAEHRETLLVAVDGGRIVGSAALELYGEAVLLRSVAVDPAQRGRGLGLALTHAALDLATDQGAAAVYLLTETAGKFFDRLGFRPIPRAQAESAVGRSVEFTSTCPTSATCMVLALSRSTAGAQP